ncbi:MAG: hypothetical protein ACK559_31635, partial [bacterium]
LQSGARGGLLEVGGQLAGGASGLLERGGAEIVEQAHGALLRARLRGEPPRVKIGARRGLEHMFRCLSR